MIEINTIEELNSVRNNPNESYILMRDLDFQDDDSYENPSNKNDYITGDGFNPIGTNGNYFTGVFDGNGHSIKNLFINRNTTDFCGLFSQALTNSEIRSLIIEDADITGKDYSGVIVGASAGVIKDCYAGGNITGNISIGGAVGYNLTVIYNVWTDTNVSGVSYIGGIVGLNDGGNVQYCKSHNQVTGTNLYVGGIAGDNNGTIKYSISNTNADNDNQITGSFAGRNRGTIQKGYSIGNVQSVLQGGGFVGQNTGTIINCYSVGNVERKSGTSTSFAGFCGNNNNGKVIRCYSTGKTTITISGTPTAWRGFIGAETIGTNYRDYGNFWDIELSESQSNIGNAEGKTTQEMKLIDTFVDRLWNIKEKSYETKLSEFIEKISKKPQSES